MCNCALNLSIYVCIMQCYRAADDTVLRPMNTVTVADAAMNALQKVHSLVNHKSFPRKILWNVIWVTDFAKSLLQPMRITEPKLLIIR